MYHTVSEIPGTRIWVKTTTVTEVFLLCSSPRPRPASLVRLML
jgi:hypothetical protein